MFARLIEFVPKMEKKEEFVKLIRKEILPILKEQAGYLEILPLFPDNKMDKMITITLWMEKRHAERYEREVYPKVENILRPYLSSPVTVKTFNVETTLCEHFAATLAA